MQRCWCSAACQPHLPLLIEMLLQLLLLGQLGLHGGHAAHVVVPIGALPRGHPSQAALGDVREHPAGAQAAPLQLIHVRLQQAVSERMGQIQPQPAWQAFDKLQRSAMGSSCWPAISARVAGQLSSRWHQQEAHAAWQDTARWTEGSSGIAKPVLAITCWRATSCCCSAAASCGVYLPVAIFWCSPCRCCMKISCRPSAGSPSSWDVLMVHAGSCHVLRS